MHKQNADAAKASGNLGLKIALRRINLTFPCLISIEYTLAPFVFTSPLSIFLGTTRKNTTIITPWEVVIETSPRIIQCKELSCAQL